MKRISCERVAIGLALLTALAAAPAYAQDIEPPRRRQGYYLALGLGSGASHIKDDGDSLGVGGGSRFGLRFGQLVTRRFGLGLLFEGMGVKKGEATAGGGGVSLEANLSLIGNLALRGTAGFAALELVDKSEPDPDDQKSGGFGAQYGAGISYDWFPKSGVKSGGLAITPTLDVRWLPGTTSSIGAFVGVEIAWWTGLPKNELELPESEAYGK